MKKILVALSSLAIALAANFGIASAHPFRDPTPSSEPTPRVDNRTTAASPDNDVKVEANEAEPEKQQAEMNDVDEKVEDEDEDADEDEDEADEDKDEDKDEADEHDAARVQTPGRTSPVTTAGKDERGRHGDRDRERERSGHSGHDDD